MNTHLAGLLSMGAQARDFIAKHSSRRSAVQFAAAASLGVLLPACGFINSDTSVAPDAAIASTTPDASAPQGAVAQPAQQGSASANVAVTAAPTQAPMQASTPTVGKTNSADMIVDDMKLNNDLVLAGVPSSRGYAAGPGFVVMGNDPRGTRTPTWWNPANSYFKSAAYWTNFVPWMVVFDGVGNAATNTRVEFRNAKAYYKSRSSGQWIFLSEGAIDGWNYPKGLNPAADGPADIVSVGNGVMSVRPPNGDLHFHGWWNGRTLPAPADIAAIHITLQARLTVHNSAQPDDRSAARYLVQVGGDYYPDASLSIAAFAPVNYNPGIGLSRSKLVGNGWQSYSFTTINVGVQDPGGASISEAELRSAPPPPNTTTVGRLWPWSSQHRQGGHRMARR